MPAPDDPRHGRWGDPADDWHGRALREAADTFAWFRDQAALFEAWPEPPDDGSVDP